MSIKEKWVSEEELRANLSIATNVLASNVGGLTTGSIPFAGATGFLTEDNAALFWDSAEKNLGIGTKVFGATMTQGMQMKTGLAPTGNVADTFAFFSKDFAGGNACPHFRTENGTVIGLNQSLFTTDNVTFGTIGCGGPLTITQNSDTLILSHDGSSAYVKWSDGDLTLMTDEGTNTDTHVSILGKGTGVGLLEVYDTDEDSYIILGWKGDDQPSITCDATPTEFNLLHDRPVDIKCWSSIISGNPYFYTYGFKTADARKYLRQRVEADGDALIEAENNLNIIAGGGAISFGDENLSTIGTLGCGVLTSGNIIIPDAGTIGSASATGAINIDASGNVGIGGAAVGSTFEVLGNPHAVLRIEGAVVSSACWNYFSQGGNSRWLQGCEGNSTQYRIFDSSDSSVAVHIVAGGTSWVSGSDRRMKRNIVDMESRLDDIMGIKVRRFNWRADKKEGFGFIAQELKDYIPEAVFGEEKEEYCEKATLTQAKGQLREPMGVSRELLIPALVKAIQELNDKIITLKAQLNN